MNDLIEAVRPLEQALVAFRRDLHAHPELAFAEHRTAQRVADALAAAGIETHRGIGGTGVVGVLRGQPGGRTIALRADMDALSITERNAFAHRSTIAGVMHGCGHDGHTTMLLGAAQALASAAVAFAGTVLFIFQPAEEGEGGAAAMIADGLFERFEIDAVYGMHNWPGLAAGRFAVHEAAVMASADRFDICFSGVGTHAAMPHLGRDPVVAAAAFVQAAQSLVSRRLDPLAAGVVSITQFHAGEAYNVIPDRAQLSGTVRSFAPEVRRQLESELEQLARSIGAAHGIEVEFSFKPGYPATINTAVEAGQCARAVAALVGEQALERKLPPSMGAEDFADFLQHRPGAYIWIGNGPGEGGCTLHNPHYDFNDDILGLGAAYWCSLVATVLGVAAEGS